MKTLKALSWLAVFSVLACTSSEDNGQSDSSTAEYKVLSDLAEKTKITASALTKVDSFPRNISEGKTNWNLVDVKDWCSGFWPGVLWYAYEASGDEALMKDAIRFTLPLKEIAYKPAENHDVGFMVNSSYGNAYRLTGDEEYKEVLIAAANNLVTLYDPKVGTILSWPSQMENYQYNTIIDNMMNLELLFWASKNGGGQNLYDVAMSHAEKTMEHLVRSDSALYHVGSFDQKTGKFLRGYTHQGYATESMWARGQSWGIYGFSVAYRETGDEEFLKTAIRLTEHYIDRLPEDGIPFWDFDDPAIPNAPKDASAAAVAACGMLELAGLVEEPALKEKYEKAAESYISKLSSSEYLSGDTNEALLLHSTGHYPHDSEIDMPIIYADYYYMEALLRLKRLKNP
ncbi:glycoside hydrolase family 88 protein [uncultured Arcticibacterium sp.]|uniref:glycoside hydrolase family 88 protein n=1 Tax=uncultured Arcticibacterium sp. TaxID=2173042 RepID=UPI0030F5E0A1